MSLQWSLVAGFLYSEIVVLIILLLPIISPQRWNKIFRSKILHSLGAQTALYWYGLFGLLLLLFLDAVREMRKYSSEEYDLLENPKAEMQAHMKLFRAQRNFYISGFALLLSAIIRRITTLLSMQAGLMAENEAALKQAASASKAASAMLDQQSADSKGSGKKAGASDEVAKMQTQINTLKEDLAASIRDKDVLKSQAENVNKEYDRLMSEHEKLQKKLAIAGGDKKAD